VSHSLFACDLFCTLSHGLDYISNSNPACSCDYFENFSFALFTPPPSRRLSDQPGEKQVFGPDVLLEAEENIKTVRENLKIAQSRQ
jgi:hypothetical protein